jgi:hypothetical protein
MVVRWRPELWANADGTTKVTKVAKITKPQLVLRDLRGLRTFVVKASTRSFYFAHCGTGDDDGEREEEKRGRDLS